MNTHTPPPATGLPTIQSMAAEWSNLQSAFEAGDFDDEWGGPAAERACDLQVQVIATPARTLDDLLAKLAIWGHEFREFGNDILDKNPTAWELLIDDVAHVARGLPAEAAR